MKYSTEGAVCWGIRLVPVISLSLFVAVAVFANAQTTIIAMGGGPTGGSFLATVAGFADVLESEIPGVRASIESTGGGRENLVLVSRQDVDLGITTADLAYQGYNQLNDFDAPQYAEIRALTGGTVFARTFVVRADSPYQDIESLRGRRVALGPPGSTNAHMAELILEYHGITLDDISANFLSFAEMTPAMQDRVIDAAFYPIMAAPGDATYPTFAELIATTRVRILYPEGEEADALYQDHPYYRPVDVRAELFAPGTPEADLPSPAIMSIAIVHSSMPEELAYSITKALFENGDRLGHFHPEGPNYADPEFLDLVPIPFHPGAERYFHERGWID